MAPSVHARAGFTLTEMAVVLLIIALLLGGMMLPLAAQDEQRRSDATQKKLEEIRLALLGYALLNKHLPCPMAEATSNPADARYGYEDTSQCAKEGLLPWKTLGVEETDAWGSPRLSTSAPYNGHWHYRVDINFSTAGSGIQLSPTPTTTGNAMLVRERRIAQSNTGDVVAVIYSLGPNRLADGDNADSDPASYETGIQLAAPYYFDDRLIWISRPVLFGHLAASGAL